MKSLNMLVFILVFVLSVFSLNYWNKIESISFNWFKIPDSNEIYFFSHDKQTDSSVLFEIFSSDERQCALKTCAGESEINLNSGQNKINYSIANCMQTKKILTNVTCDNLNLHFYTDITNEKKTYTAQLQKFSIANKESFSYSLPIILILVLVLSRVLWKKYRLDTFWVSLVFYSLVVIFFVLSFQLANNFKLSQFIVPFSILIFIFLLKKLKGLGRTISIPKNIKKEALAFALIYTSYVLILKMFIGVNDVWWPYYSRNSENTFLKGTTFFEDNLSYLGRDFTFPPVFFEFASQISTLFNAKSFYDMQFPLHIFIVFMFAFTSYLLFMKFESKNQRVIASLMYISLVFTFLTSVAGTLHTFSFTLLNLSVIFFNNSNGLFKKLSPVMLGFSYATHPLTLFMFPVYVYATNLFKINIKNIFLTMFTAVLVSLLFYIPIFLRSGLPSEIVPRQWGYLITYGTAGMYFDFQFLLPLIFMTFTYGIFNKKFRLQSILILFLAITYLNISYRLNMFLSMLLAGTFVTLFKEELKHKLIFNIVFSILIFNFLFLAVIYSGTKDWCTWGAVNDMCLSPMNYIKTYTSPSESVAINPVYGHLETYYGQRKVLADLYVEYADYNKFKAEEDFYKSSDISMLEPYNITVFVLDDIEKIRDLPNEDRIYDNGFFHIFRKA